MFDRTEVMDKQLKESTVLDENNQPIKFYQIWSY